MKTFRSVLIKVTATVAFAITINLDLDTSISIYIYLFSFKLNLCNYTKRCSFLLTTAAFPYSNKCFSLLKIKQTAPQIILLVPLNTHTHTHTFYTTQNTFACYCLSPPTDHPSSKSHQTHHTSHSKISRN